MKRLCSSDSVAGFMSICPNTTEEHSPRSNNIYSREFQTMLEGLDEEGCIEESGHIPEKKRRLSVEQVKALEKNFEVENKLEPDRKVKLAQELGLQPRQVAVWFQNRRARWKTKQLEKDYVVLKTNYDALKLNYETLQHDNEALLKEIRELKSKLQEDTNTKTNNSVQQEETLVPEKDLKLTDQPKPSSENNDFNYDSLEDGLKAPPFLDFKDGSSDSDSSAILNEDNCISSGILQSNPSLVMSPTSSPLDFNHCSSSLPSSSMGCFQFQKIYQSQQFSKIEEHNFFSADEACNLFTITDEWYSADQWS